MQDIDHLVLKVLDVQNTRQKMHQLQEELNWEKHNSEAFQGESHRHTHAHTGGKTHGEKSSRRAQTSRSNVQSSFLKSRVIGSMFFPGPHQHNGLNQTLAEIQKVQNKIQQLDFNLKTMATVGLAAQPPATYNLLTQTTVFPHSLSFRKWHCVIFVAIFYFFWCV